MSSTSTSEACLSSNELAVWVEGKLDDEARSRALSHVSRCAACREASSLLAALHSVDLAFAALPETPTDGADDDRAAIPELGSHLGRFRIEKVIGKGGMGLVLRARDERLDRDVAIKLVHVSGAKHEALAARLVSEAKALAALTHPNLVTVYEAGEHAGKAYLVMELVDGENLRAHVATKRPSWRAGLALCLAAGSGLAALHAAGFVHRDVKPDNVLIAKDGRVLLADLGLAKRLDSDAADALEIASFTRTGAIVGTPRYLAPERVAGQPGDVRSDVYAFAAMTLEIVRGCEGAVPQRVVALLSRGLDPDPAMRFGSIDELSRSVGGAARSRRLPVALAGGVLVALAAIAAARGRASDSGSSRTPMQSEPDRASGSASAAPVEVTTGSAEPPLQFAAAEPSALPLADASPSAPSAPRATAARAAPVASPMGWPPFVLAPGASQFITFGPAPTLERLVRGDRDPVTTASGEEILGERIYKYASARLKAKSEATGSPLGLDWGKVERSDIVGVEDNRGKKQPWLLYQVAGWQKRWLFRGTLSRKFLDVAVGDWVFVCPGEADKEHKVPAGWQGDLVTALAFGPIAGPPAFWSRKPRPYYIDNIHLESENDREPGKWPFGEGPLLFTVNRPPKSFIAEGRVDMGTYFLELTNGTKGVEALKSVAFSRPAWVIAKLSGYQDKNGTDYPVLRVDEVRSTLFDSPPAKPSTHHDGAAEVLRLQGQERDDERELAKRRDGGAPSAIVSPKGAP